MEKFWKAALTAGGIGTIGAFVLWSLYKDWLHLPIFRQLSSEQTFILMLVFLSFTFVSLVVILLVHLKTKLNSNHLMADKKEETSITLVDTNLDTMNPLYEQHEKEGKKIIRPKRGEIKNEVYK